MEQFRLLKQYPKSDNPVVRVDMRHYQLLRDMHDHIARQLLYHTLSVINGPYVSQEIKAAALRPELLAVANGFRHVDECGEITVKKED